MASRKKIPLAYFITFTCYGTWLHGKRETSVDLKHNTPRTAFLTLNTTRQLSVENRMRELPYDLNQYQREIVLSAIIDVCKYRAWTLLAVHVRTNHVHLVVHAAVSPEVVMNATKAYASRNLNQSKLDGNKTKRWSRHGSTRYLWNEAEVEATIQYVIREQGNLMAVYENKDRVFAIGDVL